MRVCCKYSNLKTVFTTSSPPFFFQFRKKSPSSMTVYGNYTERSPLWFDPPPSFPKSISQGIVPQKTSKSCVPWLSLCFLCYLDVFFPQTFHSMSYQTSEMTNCACTKIIVFIFNLHIQQTWCIRLTQFAVKTLQKTLYLLSYPVNNPISATVRVPKKRKIDGTGKRSW